MFRYSFLFRNVAEPVIKATQQGAVVTLTINRPNQMNALNNEVASGLLENLQKYDSDPSCAVFIITGAGRAFVAGADIKQMKDRTFSDYVKSEDFAGLKGIPHIGKPIIAAVNGVALGGGCELVMLCDIVVASEKAKFGQPEINLGTIPGLGGTQRLPRAIGKSKAMEWSLTGWHYTAEEAERAGLVSRVVKHEELMPTAMKIAEAIAKQSMVTVKLAKSAVNMSQETSLEAGLRFERMMFNSTFATADRKEGMAAFVEKRPPAFKNE